MKKLLILLIFSLGIYSCSKKDSPSPGTSSSTLSSSEKQVSGTWYLSELADTLEHSGVIDTEATKTYSVFTTTPYVTFSDSSVGDGHFYCQDGCGIIIPTGGVVLTSVVSSTYWSIDNTTGDLIVYTWNFTIQSQTSTNLVLKFIVASTATDIETRTYYFHK
ncbi:MAG TPA: hypothetical protein VN721_10035 [Flavipsychrobacter sp.]|nr:hypothetical protein [Flavipsychrobacter sp.]